MVHLIMDPYSQTQFKTASTKSTLRKSKSVSTLRNKPRRITGLIRRFVTGCNSVLTKLKSLSDIALAEEDEVDALFESSDSDYFPRRQPMGNLKHVEQQFLNDFQKYKSLDGISEHYLSLDTKIDMNGEQFDKIAYKDLDIAKLREKLESENLTLFTSDISTENSDETRREKQNLGEALWDFRRSVWLKSNGDKDAVETDAARDTHKDIPKNCYPAIYSNLIEKSKPLREGKRINLQDLLGVINEGWIQDQRWERAAKGVA